MRNRLLLFPARQVILFTLLIISSYSQIAYSADPGVCSPSNGTIPELHIDINMTAPPLGVTTGQGYTYPVVVAAPGAITCQPTDPAPKTYSVYTEQNGSLGGFAEASVDIGEGYKFRLQVGRTPGFATMSMWGIKGGSSPVISQPVYAAVLLYPPATTRPGIQDIVIKDEIDLGYIVVSENDLNNIKSATSSNDGLTHVFVKGVIHIPPTCTLTPSPLAVEMPTLFAADFAAAGVGGPVGTPTKLEVQGVCTGGGHEGVADLVHISLYSNFAGDNANMIGVQGVPEIGLTVSDNEGKLLPVNGAVAGTVLTKQEVVGDQKMGKFSYPMSFQLISRTGTAPKPTAGYHATVTMSLSID
ncbi:hypothetical protein LJPFL01_1085 [Lelliottia jeotgali]|nr:hypothetical protein LJPFL01_1085 [Lelliottia jeotgali]